MRQAWSCTLAAQYIISCPNNHTGSVSQDYPALHIYNQANSTRISGSYMWKRLPVTVSTLLNSSIVPAKQAYLNKTEAGIQCSPAVTSNRTNALSYAGRRVFLSWDVPDKPNRPNNT